MTREEEIEEFAKTYDCCYVDNNYYAIKAGIEWADEHPSEEIQRLKTMLESNSDAYKQGYKDAVDKTVEFLKYYIGKKYNFFRDEDIEAYKKAVEE